MLKLHQHGSHLIFNVIVSFNQSTDWEAIADLASNELLPPQVEAGVSNITLEDIKVQAPKRRGRGSFLYKKNGLYSDQAADGAPIDNSEDELSGQYPKEDADIRNCESIPCVHAACLVLLFIACLCCIYSYCLTLLC